MEYQVLKRGTSAFPKRLLDRLGKDAPAQLYYHGQLGLLNRFTMAVACADSIDGQGLNETNQLLFTIREYDLNYIGGWHSIMETEIFRLGLYRSNLTVALFTAKGLGHETFESFLRDRFFPPFDDFPERDEYFRRVESDELLVLSLVEPELPRTLRRNAIERNWVSCALSDVVFIPYGPKGSKTYRLARRIKDAGWPVFTLEHALAADLHELGIPGFSRKSVGEFLNGLGAKEAAPEQRNVARTSRKGFPELSTPGPRRNVQGKIPFASDKLPAQPASARPQKEKPAREEHKN